MKLKIVLKMGKKERKSIQLNRYIQLCKELEVPKPRLKNSITTVVQMNTVMTDILQILDGVIITIKGLASISFYIVLSQGIRGDHGFVKLGKVNRMLPYISRGWQKNTNFGELTALSCLKGLAGMCDVSNNIIYLQIQRFNHCMLRNSGIFDNVVIAPDQNKNLVKSSWVGDNIMNNRSKVTGFVSRPRSICHLYSLAIPPLRNTETGPFIRYTPWQIPPFTISLPLTYLPCRELSLIHI